ncbi:hypothetical protein ASZ78_005102 [Callipepla squamata]|uniref:Peptidase M14 domain-containing protein n=1 Tax=Callipepla squamata TaxID=9009 RepID=A0A226MYF9_CALSU|nr:hypothetical protein ASZ78_005102 [Callipepla squamata]
MVVGEWLRLQYAKRRKNPGAKENQNALEEGVGASGKKAVVQLRHPLSPVTEVGLIFYGNCNPGIIDFLVSQHPIAKVLRDHLVFKIAPMLNPDGVYLGNYRCSLMGFDLNRHWANPSPWAHPTLHGVKQLIVEMYNDPVSGEGNARAAIHLRVSNFIVTTSLGGSGYVKKLDTKNFQSFSIADFETVTRDRQASGQVWGVVMVTENLCLHLWMSNQRKPGAQKINLEFYIDIHAHSTMMNGFMYGNIFENEERFQRQAVFPKLLCQNAEDFSYVSKSSHK